MRSLQVKFTALVVALLVVACAGLAWIGVRHERRALESEAASRARALAAMLAGAAKDPFLEARQGGFGAELALERLVAEAAASEGVVAVRLVDRTGRVLASLDPEERGKVRPPAGEASARGDALRVQSPIVYSEIPIGQAEVEVDLRAIVDPVVERTRRQLAFVTGAVLVLGVLGGIVFVALLVGPLRRLRAGVERLSAGDFTARVAPTSRDEVGELTRAFNEMGESLLQKQRIQTAFGRYVSDYVLAQLLEGLEDGAQGVEREVTVLFVDVRSFTRLSEGMKARDVVALLNEVFQLVSDRILERGGTIDKFIGDSVMAYFGAPVPQPDHAQRAVASAIEIAEAVEERNRGAAGSGGVSVEIGIGVHTGTVVVGNIGSDRRTDFTAVGDAVNVAHRLEKQARPGEILVSEEVQRRVRGTARLRFEGERRLSGREESVHVYSVERPDAGTPADAPAGP